MVPLGAQKFAYDSINADSLVLMSHHSCRHLVLVLVASLSQLLARCVWNFEHLASIAQSMSFIGYSLLEHSSMDIISGL